MTLDLTTCAEYDPQGDVAVYVDYWDAPALEFQTDPVYIEKDFGEESTQQVGGDGFTHTFYAVYGTGAAGAPVAVWYVGENPGQPGYEGAGAWAWFAFEYYGGPTYHALHTSEGDDIYGNTDIDNSGDWYYTVIDDGAGTLSVECYSDADKNNLVETLTAAVVSAQRYRYLYPLNMQGNGPPPGTGYTYDIEAGNYNLNAGATPVDGDPAGLHQEQALEQASGIQTHVATPVGLHQLQVLETTTGEPWAPTPSDLHHEQALAVASGTQTHVATPAGLAQQQALGPGGSGAQTGRPASGAHDQILGTASGVQTHGGTPSSLHHDQLLGLASGLQTHVGSPLGLAHEQVLGIASTDDLAGSPTGLHQMQVLEKASGTQAHVATPARIHHEQSLETSLGFLHVHLYVSVPEDGRRRLSWEEPGTVYLVIDGRLEAEITDGRIDLDAARQVRGILIGYLRRMPEHLPTPRDEVLLSITGDPVLHHVERQPDGGEWERIASILPSQEATYRDGPLDDGLWYYRAVAQDEEGDTATSEVESVTVSSMPDPPSGLDWTWDADTSTLTLTWQASPSLDVASYRVRRGEHLLSWNAEPVQDSPDSEYVPVIEAGTTGVLIFSVRAVDADGNEERNVSQVLAIPFEDGAPAGRPAEPRWVEARAIEGGRIELEWLYDPRYEDYGPGAASGAQGAAAEARIYWDAGTGTIDSSAPHAAVALGNTTEPTRYTWQSAPLTDGQTYRFVVRVATAPWPSGLETQNAAFSPATADASEPVTPTIVLKVL